MEVDESEQLGLSRSRTCGDESFLKFIEDDCEYYEAVIEFRSLLYGSILPVHVPFVHDVAETPILFLCYISVVGSRKGFWR